MKILILIFSFLYLNISFAQDETRRSDVELPDFVITGKDVISLRPSKKMSPDFVSTISENFIKPSFSPDELEIREFSNPLKQEINLLETVPFYNGKIDLEMGRFYLPKADFRYTFLYDGGYFNTNLNGFNKRAHVEKSEEFSIKAGVKTGYFIPNTSSFLPGSELKGGFDYDNGLFRMFGSDTPEKERSLVNGDLNFGFRNLMMRNVNFGVDANYIISSIKEEEFSSNLISTRFFTDMNFNNLNVGAFIKFEKPETKIDSLSISENSFINGKTEFGLSFSNNIKVKFGFVYASFDTSRFLSPLVSLGLKLNENLSMFASYNPNGEFLPFASLIQQNRYLKLINNDGIFFKKKNSMNFNIKYEYSKFFGINFGLSYESFENYPYFSDSSIKGFFDINTTDVKKGSIFTDLLFHAGPYGTFYGNITATQARDTAENNIPYIPSINAKLSYTYNFNNGITSELLTSYQSERFTNLINNESLEGFLNLGLKLTYKMSENFFLTCEFMNLLNKENYLWKNYQDLPLNISFGIKHKW